MAASTAAPPAQEQSPLTMVKQFAPLAVLFYRAKVNEFVPEEYQIRIFGVLILIKVILIDVLGIIPCVGSLF